MNILLFTHYFPPEGNAPASRGYDHAVRWVRAGHRVTVITCAPNVPDGVIYPGYRNRLWPQRSEMDGIDVIRVWTYVAANKGGGRRILNYVSFLISALFAYLFCVKRPDVIVATSPQFFCGWAGVIAKYLKRAPFILEIRDIWPESIVTVGAMKPGLFTRMLEWMERRMYLAADHIVAVGKGYRRKILERANVEGRISIITNGVDIEQFHPMERDLSFLHEHGMEGRFVCSYVGTIGMAHGLETVLDAAEHLRHQGRDDVVFALIGDGAEREKLEQEAARRGLDHFVKFTGRISKDHVNSALASSDCVLVHLRKCELFGTVIPSKIFEAMAMAKPLVMGVKGEAADIVRRSRSGVDVEPEDAVELATVVCQLADDPALYNRLKRFGRRFVAEYYSRDVLADRYLKLIEAIVHRKVINDQSDNTDSSIILAEELGGPVSTTGGKNTQR